MSEFDSSVFIIRQRLVTLVIQRRKIASVYRHLYGVLDAAWASLLVVARREAISRYRGMGNISSTITLLLSTLFSSRLIVTVAQGIPKLLELPKHIEELLVMPPYLASFIKWVSSLIGRRFIISKGKKPKANCQIKKRRG